MSVPQAASVRGLQLRTEAADRKLKTQGCAVSASFNTEGADGTELKTWYGRVQQILLLHSEPQLFLKVVWTKHPLLEHAPTAQARSGSDAEDLLLPTYIASLP